MHFKIAEIPLLSLILLSASCTTDRKPVKVTEARLPKKAEVTINDDSLIISNDMQKNNRLLDIAGKPAKVVLLYEDKIEITIPESFKQLDKRMLANKYPNANPPEVAFSNKDGSVNIAFRYNSRVARGTEPAKLVQMLSANLKSAGLEPTIGIENINGRGFALVEFMSDAHNAKIYNHMAATVIDGLVMICTFNCTTRQLKEWKAAGNASLKSIQING